MMYSAVPATGVVNSAAIRHTDPHRARGLSKSTALNCQQARSNKKIDAMCHANSPISNGK